MLKKYPRRLPKFTKILDDTPNISEIKFSKNLVDSSVIDEVQKKIDALKYAKGYSCRPVLIHVNGVTDDVVDSDFFASIIDFSNGLEDNS